MQEITRRRFLQLAGAAALLGAAPARAQQPLDPLEEARDAAPVRKHFITADGMQPTLAPGDLITVDQSAAAKAEIARGAIVTFRNAHGAIYVKRAIGLPGESIQFVEGAPVIDGATLRQEPIGPFEDALRTRFPGGALTILEEFAAEGGSWRVLDAERPGPFDDTPRVEIPPDFFFLVGDFRDNSADSRVRDIGVVPREAILGQVVEIARG